MSLNPRLRDGTNIRGNNTQQQAEAAAATSSSSSWRRHSFPHSVLKEKKSKLEESDEDLFRVPDMEAAAAGMATSASASDKQTSNTSAFPGKRRRGRNPADKEYRRLKRLLRNRVSAQQARERKKVYVNDLESRAKVLEDINSKLEERMSTLINENAMLRKVLINTRPKIDQSIEPKHHLSPNTSQPHPSN